MTLLIFTEKLHVKEARCEHIFTKMTRHVVKKPIMYLHATKHKKTAYT